MYHRQKAVYRAGTRYGLAVLNPSGLTLRVYQSLAGKDTHGTERKKRIFGGFLCVMGEPTPAISDLGERRVCR